MAKSALCIGAVTVLAVSTSQGGSFRSAIEGEGRAAAAGLGQACAESDACVGIGSRIVSEATGHAGAVPDSVTRAVIAQASAALAGPETSAAAAPIVEAGHPPRPAERRIRRGAASRD